MCRPISVQLGALTAVMILCLSAPQVVAGQIIGRVDSVALAQGTVSIDGAAYEIHRGRGQASSRGLETQLRNLKPGQVVYYQLEDGKVTAITVLPGLKEIPH
ncbi:MAG: hypothetical protein M0R77_05470 [Gammaproteobacteria bacterium]|nr:hypothetical protein [Gammaproteobacteria bacterium]